MKKKLTARLKEAVHKRSLFGKAMEIADRRRHAFNQRLTEQKARFVSQEAILRTLKQHESADEQHIEDEEQVLYLIHEKLERLRKKRNFWRARYVSARERHMHWGTVLRHRKDRVRAWAQKHESFQPYMANGKPYEKLTPEAKHGIYLDFKEGLYVTSTYEGFSGDGVHTPTSYHYITNQPEEKGRCWDAGSTKLSVMEGCQRRQTGQFPSYLTEQFGPINDLAYKNGIRETLPEGSALETLHDNHVHTDIRDGAFA